MCSGLASGFPRSDIATHTMPWFKRLRFGRKKSKKTKTEISEPTSFQHCYHATVDNAGGGFLGLPPQWLGLIVGSVSATTSEKPPPKSPSSSRASSSTVVHVVAPSSLETRGSVGFVVEPPPVTSAVTTTDGEETERGGSVAPGEEGETTPRTASYRSGNSSPVSSVLTTSRESASTTTTTSSGARRVPIIRGSDGCLEETIKYIRKHYRSASSASPASFEEDAAPEGHYVDIHFGSRSRSGSLMQLRGGRAASRTPSNGSPRPNPAAFASSTHTVSNTSVGPLSSNSAFCMSAPQDLNVVQSDLGLYDCEPTSTSNTTLFRSRIHSPSESSGYFGSTMSSLCSSRISALSSIPQIHATPSNSAATQPTTATSTQATSSTTTSGQTHRCSALREASEFPWIHPQMRHGQPHFSSLQRPVKFCRNGSENTPHSATTTRPYHHGNSGSNIANFGGSPPTQYGTNPRPYTHRPRGESVDSALISRSYREKTAHEPSRYQYTRGNQTHNTTRSEPHTSALSPYSPSSPPQAVTAATCPPRNFHPAMRRQQFHQHRRPAMTSEQFRTTLELLVNRSDPRRDYCELAKIGEGSTGVVYLAKEIATGRKVAVKKMNIRRQQRRELLFNEVSSKTFSALKKLVV